MNSMSNNEDERLRKTTIAFLKDFAEQSYENAVECIDWLEKQVQKPTDETAPKFHEGEWIIRSAEGFKHNSYLVKEVKDYYVCEDLKGRRVTFTFSDVHKNFKLWNISDAKDGDVLTWDNSKCIAVFKNIYDEDSFNGYGFVGHCTGTFESGLSFHDIEGARPATKEQRDTLMKAMADVGYTFDFEKKELKKVEQKLDDEIESRFKVGDWIVNRLDDLWHIDSFDKKNYQISDGKGNYNYFSILKQDEMHLWTIKDAKHGDVLAYDTVVLIFDHLGTFENRPIIYSWYFADSKKFYGMGTSDPDRWEVEGFYPATKEQRTELFLKMHEAGYEWDDEKKELKKIEQKSVIKMITPEESLGISSEEYNKIVDECIYGDDKPAWDEEDEKNWQGVIDEIKANRSSAPDYDIKVYDKYIDWLKTLKQRLGGEK